MMKFPFRIHSVMPKSIRSLSFFGLMVVGLLFPGSRASGEVVIVSNIQPGSGQTRLLTTSTANTDMTIAASKFTLTQAYDISKVTLRLGLTDGSSFDLSNLAVGIVDYDPLAVPGISTNPTSILKEFTNASSFSSSTPTEVDFFGTKTLGPGQYWLYAASTIPTNVTNGGVAWRYISPVGDIPAGQQGVNNQSRIYNEASNSWGSLVTGRPYIYSITAVPEPTSMALVALAGGAYAWRRRLQKRSKV
jgi:hypothetical protein